MSPGDRNVPKDPWYWVCSPLSTITGIRQFPSWTIKEQTATKLVNAGAAFVSDLRLPQFEVLLKPTQKVGVMYGEHVTRSIPRAEAEGIAVRILCIILSFIRLMFTATKAFICGHISCNFEIHLTGA